MRRAYFDPSREISVHHRREVPKIFIYILADKVIELKSPSQTQMSPSRPSPNDTSASRALDTKVLQPPIQCHSLEIMSSNTPQASGGHSYSNHKIKPSFHRALWER